MILECKIFSSENIFEKMKIFSSVLSHHKKWFEKYFKVFGCVPENPLENTFSHIFSTSKQIL